MYGPALCIVREQQDFSGEFATGSSTVSDTRAIMKQGTNYDSLLDIMKTLLEGVTNFFAEDNCPAEMLQLAVVNEACLCIHQDAHKLRAANFSASRHKEVLKGLVKGQSHLV